MSRVRKAITASFFSFFFFFSSINVIFYFLFFRECMPVESPVSPPFPQILCVCVGGGGGGGGVGGRGGGWLDVQARVVYVSE